MFDSLALEDPRSSRRGWATFTSFTIETLLLGLLIAAPLVYTEQIKFTKFVEIVAPMAMPAEAPAQAPDQHHATNTSRSELTPDGNVIAPSSIPTQVTTVVDAGPVTPVDIGVPNGVPWSTSANPTMRNLMEALRPRVEVAQPNVPHAPIKISNLDAGFLISRVQPVYPKMAIATRTEGTVVLAAVIDTNGRITQLRSISGHPFLIPAAIDAVRQWRYKPYVLNGSPVEVETQVSVIFTLNR